MNVIIFILLIWGACAIINKVSARARENARQREIERMKAEQARQRMEQQRQREAIKQREREAREQARRQVEHDKAIARAAKEREAMRKEQARQAAQLAKHEQELSAIRFKLERAIADIEYLEQHTAELNAQMDYALLQQAASVPGSKTFEKCQSKIVSLNKQIHTAETQLAKAQYTKAQAAAKLNA